MQAAWEDEARAVIDAKIASEAYDDIQKQLSDTVQEYLDYQREFEDALDPDVVTQYEEKIGDLTDALDLAEDAQKQANAQVREARD